jgi:transcriptional regulator with XRE-family HTH domain
MPSDSGAGLGRRIAYYRGIARPRLTQQELADAAQIHVGTLRKIERGARGAGDAVVEAIADALRVDASLLVGGHPGGRSRVLERLPHLSSAIAEYDSPEPGPVRPVAAMEADVRAAVQWRLAGQYARITGLLPDLLSELQRALEQARPEHRARIARALVAAYRAADAAAYKFGAKDLSARLIGLMHWASQYTREPTLDATVAYVRAETHLAAGAYAAGLRALERAIDRAPGPTCTGRRAARGALHMRAAVVAGRAGDDNAAHLHLEEARSLSEGVGEGIHEGTAFGPDSVRVHEVAVAVSLGGTHVVQALELARTWQPGDSLPAERRSGFHIELARAQLRSGRIDAAFRSLETARAVAPQHTREHPWVRRDVQTMRRLKRGDATSLTAFALWCQADRPAG